MLCPVPTFHNFRVSFRTAIAVFVAQAGRKDAACSPVKSWAGACPRPPELQDGCARSTGTGLCTKHTYAAELWSLLPLYGHTEVLRSECIGPRWGDYSPRRTTGGSRACCIKTRFKKWKALTSGSGLPARTTQAARAQQRGKKSPHDEHGRIMLGKRLCHSWLTS